MAWEGQARHKHFSLLFSLRTFHNFTTNASGQPVLLTSHSPHPLPLERCKVNISIGLQWPVSAALIPTLLFEGSIVPDLLAWFACLWIMARQPQSGLLPSALFLLITGLKLKIYTVWLTVIYTLMLWSLSSSAELYTWTGMHCRQCSTDSGIQSQFTTDTCLQIPQVPYTGVWTEASNTKKWQLQFCCATWTFMSSITHWHDKLVRAAVSSLSPRVFEFGVSISFLNHRG